MTSILNRCFDKVKIRIKRVQNFARYRYRICPGHAVDQFFVYQDREMHYQLGYSNVNLNKKTIEKQTTEEIEKEEVSKMNYLKSLTKYNIVFKNKVNIYLYSYYIQLAFIINDVDNYKQKYHSITVPQYSRSVDLTINNHILYLSHPMPSNGIYESAYGVFL